METKSRYLSRRSFLAKSSTAILALAFAGPRVFAQSSKPLNADMELAIDFAVLNPRSGRGKRPYVAVWIEDSQGNEVKTLALWMRKNKSKYLKHLSRWFRKMKSRSADFIFSLSSPTKSPGNYKLVWDGTDDAGKLLSQGEYYICVESSRESNGYPYQLVRQKIVLTEQEFSKVFAGEKELGDVKVEFRQRKRA